MTVVSEPGIYDLDEASYHGDPCAPELGRSLSASGAKLLLPPSAPAEFKYRRDAGPEVKDEYDFGHVAHKLVLGKGDEVTVIEAKDWRSKEAREAKRAARDKGRIPILAKEHAKAEEMAAKVAEHPLASAILSEGEAEKSLFWVDAASGVTLRARVDWLRPNAIVDYKTTAKSSAPDVFAKNAADFGYHRQAAWYSDGVKALTGKELPFIFIVQSKAPPHLVSVVQYGPDDLETARAENARAIEIYAQCESSGEWPGYPAEIETISLPRWYAAKY